MAGVLNIAKCLWDAIHRLEKKARRAEEKASAGGGNADMAASVLQVRQTNMINFNVEMSSCNAYITEVRVSVVLNNIEILENDHPVTLVIRLGGIRGLFFVFFLKKGSEVLVWCGISCLKLVGCLMIPSGGHVQ